MLKIISQKPFLTFLYLIFKKNLFLEGISAVTQTVAARCKSAKT